MVSAYMMNLASNLWGKKWRTVIIWHLRHGPLRFSRIKTLLPGCSVKVLSEALKELEGNKLIIRKQYDGIPVKVTYELHPDTVPLVGAQEVYHTALAVYFKKHAKQYKIPLDILKEMESMLLFVLYLTVE